ncbi:DUF2878 domain-containing protein [Paraburkholderia sp. D15]|uniref:DUF2878 domain-containing protein n=1 Tax=Paraburkholderia sp. D15 TaxID=2880218 RepID=UPI0024796F9E|nr:DUF2878 domain-containing protein [Paraburkholderia sp. D15]WGS52385.1 DUF2878 domain-containing protein [Paraburkholderia sp. D15]
MSRRGRGGDASAAGLYFVVCQAGWFVCVLGGAHDMGWLGMLFAACAVAWHLTRVAGPRREARLLVATVGIGMVWESVLVASGLLSYPSGTLIEGCAPYWMSALWALFAIQFNVVFAWLRTRLLLAALLGAVAGPLSFRAGASLGAVHFDQPLAAWIALGLGWAVLLPGLLRLARHWDGVHDSPRAR